jgi:hypothetical protein
MKSSEIALRVLFAVPLLVAQEGSPAIWAPGQGAIMSPAKMGFPIAKGDQVSRRFTMCAAIMLIAMPPGM